MNIKALAFVIIVIGYIGFEAHVISRNAYRMEPIFIFGTFVDASQAIERCGPLKPVDSDKFNANLNYMKHLAQADTQEDAATIDAQENERRRLVDDLVSEFGCDHIELFQLRKRYEQLARRNLPTI